MKRLRVGLETSVTGFSAAGTARYCTSLARALRAAEPPDVEIVDLQLPGRWRAFRTGLARRLLVAAWEHLYVRRLLPFRIRRGRLDLVHLTEPLPLAAARWPKTTPVLLTLHDVFPVSRPEWFGPHRARRATARIRSSLLVAHQVLASSQFTAIELARTLAWPEDRITTIHLGHFEREPKRRDPGDRERFFLAVGTLEPRKNLAAVLRAYEHLRRLGIQPPPLRVVGQPGWGGVDLARWLKEAGLEADVTALGYVSDDALADLYRRARGLIYPSLGEGFGLPPLEAMALGCPVIAARAGSLPEILGDAALWVDPERPDQIATAIQALSQDAILADHTRERGWQQAACFSWRTCAEATLHSYRATASLGASIQAHSPHVQASAAL